MKLNIRRNIFETSSSSASALIMVSDSSGNYCKLDDDLDIIIGGCFYDGYDGSPHRYISDFYGKCSYLIQHGKGALVKEIIKKKTKKQISIYYVWQYDNWGDCEYEEVPLRISKDAIALDFDKYPYLKECGIWGHENYYKYLVLPEKYDIWEYGYTNSYWNCEYADFLFDLPKELKEIFLTELIFNDGIAINIGGDAYDSDKNEGIPGQINISPEEYNGDTPIYADTKEAIKHRSYSILDCMVKNGNEYLLLGNDGTKIRFCPSDIEEPEYPESIDLKITDQCLHACAFCYEGCTEAGIHGKLDYPFLKKLPSFVELAVGGGNALLHPNLQEVTGFTDFTNLTIHENDFVSLYYMNKDPDYFWAKPEYKEINRFNAIGVSLSDEPSTGLLDCFENFGSKEYNFSISLDKNFRYRRDYEDPETEIVFHAVNGIICKEKLEQFYNLGAKLLILGYKEKGRGVEYLLDEKKKALFEERKRWLYDNIGDIVTHFKVVAFDTLAVEQLDLKRFVSEEDFNKYYMGEDGSHSMYVDLVKGEFGISSTDNRRWPIMDDVRDMFRIVRKNRNKQ